jgi:hypothetical protein
VDEVLDTDDVVLAQNLRINTITHFQPQFHMRERSQIPITQR